MSDAKILRKRQYVKNGMTVAIWKVKISWYNQSNLLLGIASEQYTYGVNMQWRKIGNLIPRGGSFTVSGPADAVAKYLALIERLIDEMNAVPTSVKP